MSQASNKVEWCLNKAKNELIASNFHRGLIIIPPNIELAKKHITKAEHNLKAALYFKEGGFSDWSPSGFFYCVYHCFLAILTKLGYESRNQECTIAVIEMLRQAGKIEIDSKFIDILKISKINEVNHSVIKSREDFQYGIDIEFTKKEEFKYFINISKEIINKSKEIIYKNDTGK